MQNHKSVDTFESSSYSQKDKDKIIERIDFIFNTTKNRLLPTFDAIEQEAEKIQNDTINELIENADPYEMDEYDCYAEGQYQGFKHYVINKEMKRELLNHQAAFLFHRFEKDCQDIFRECAQDLRTTLQTLGIDVGKNSNWRKINQEFRLVANVIKHGDGRSFKCLLQIRPDLFRSNFHTLFNPLIEISLDELTAYTEEMKNFWIDFFEKYAISKTSVNASNLI